MKYESVIGLEIHVQLKTLSKMFCRCSAETWNEPPNSHTCPVCLGLPGALPFPNRKAIEYAIMVGLALHCQPLKESKFDRKNYFYPDLPKGYQISQYDLPFSRNGWLDIEINQHRKRIRISRAHLEEDTAKLIHAEVSGRRVSLIDFNRSGIPLMEIVTEPDLSSAEEAKIFAQKLKQLIRYLKVSDADMEKGSLRVDANVSIRLTGQKKLGTKVEVKNMNSFRALEKALQYEMARQEEILERGGIIKQETRGWLENEQRTVLQRSKESAHDYRYFPEPDLPPFEISDSWVKKLIKQMPELPDAKKERFQKEFNLSSYDASLLTSQKELADWYEEAVKAYSQTAVKGIETKIDPKKAKIVANWVTGEFLRNLNQKDYDIESLVITPAHLAELLYLLEKGRITAALAKTIFSQIFETGQKPSVVISQQSLETVGEEEIGKLIEEVLRENPKAVGDFKKGKIESLEFLVGQVMRKAAHKIEPQKAREMIKKRLS